MNTRKVSGKTKSQGHEQLPAKLLTDFLLLDDKNKRLQLRYYATVTSGVRSTVAFAFHQVCMYAISRISLFLKYRQLDTSAVEIDPSIINLARFILAEITYMYNGNNYFKFKNMIGFGRVITDIKDLYPSEALMLLEKSMDDMINDYPIFNQLTSYIENQSPYILIPTGITLYLLLHHLIKNKISDGLINHFIINKHFHTPEIFELKSKELSTQSIQRLTALITTENNEMGRSNATKHGVWPVILAWLLLVTFYNLFSECIEKPTSVVLLLLGLGMLFANLIFQLLKPSPNLDIVKCVEYLKKIVGNEIEVHTYGKLESLTVCFTFLNKNHPAPSELVSILKSLFSEYRFPVTTINSSQFEIPLRALLDAKKQTFQNIKIEFDVAMAKIQQTEMCAKQIQELNAQINIIAKKINTVCDFDKIEIQGTVYAFISITIPKRYTHIINNNLDTIKEIFTGNTIECKEHDDDKLLLSVLGNKPANAQVLKFLLSKIDDENNKDIKAFSLSEESQKTYKGTFFAKNNPVEDEVEIVYGPREPTVQEREQIQYELEKQQKNELFMNKIKETYLNKLPESERIVYILPPRDENKVHKNDQFIIDTIEEQRFGKRKLACQAYKDFYQDDHRKWVKSENGSAGLKEFTEAGKKVYEIKLSGSQGVGGVRIFAEKKYVELDANGKKNEKEPVEKRTVFVPYIVKPKHKK